jgi:predicted AAA+ superfamily ATPase
VVEKAVNEFPAVVLVGPRQSDKATLLKHLYASRWPLISLEPPDVRAAVIHDPRGFLAPYPPPVIIDEIQYAPLKESACRRRNAPPMGVVVDYMFCD